MALFFKQPILLHWNLHKASFVRDRLIPAWKITISRIDSILE